MRIKADVWRLRLEAAQNGAGLGSNYTVIASTKIRPIWLCVPATIGLTAAELLARRYPQLKTQSTGWFTGIAGAALILAVVAALAALS